MQLVILSSNLPGNQIPSLGTVIDIETSSSIWDGALIFLFDEQISAGGLLSGNIDPDFNGGVLSQIISDFIEIPLLAKFHFLGPLETALKKEAGIFLPNEFIKDLSSIFQNIDDLPEGSYIKMEGDVLKLRWKDGEYSMDFDSILMQIKKDEEGNNIATTVDELTEEGNIVKSINAKTGESTTYTLAPSDILQQIATDKGYSIEELIAINQNQNLNDRFITGDNGAKMFLYEDNGILQITPADNDFDYIAYNANGVTYDSSIPVPTPKPQDIDNSYLDFQSNIDPDSNNAADTSDAWQNGSALHGGDYSAEMPIDVINGDGFTNTQPSGIVTDAYRPGAEELGDSSFSNFIDDTVDFISDIGQDELRLIR